MTLISLLVVLMLEHFFKASSWLEKELKSHQWFPEWRGWISQKVQQDWFKDWAGIAIIIGAPVILVYLLSDADNGFLFSIFQLLLSVAILVYCLGPVDQNAHLKRYFDAVKQNELQSAYHHVEDYLNLKTDQIPEDMATLGRLVTKLILSQSNFRYFGVLLYFVLLGPAGALLYRLAGTFEFAIRDDDASPYKSKLKQLRHILDWLPARMTGFLYSLAGDFNGAMPTLKSHLFSADYDNKKILEMTGVGALGLKTNECADIIEENNQALALVSRAVVILLVIIAVMTVFGWLS